MQDVSFAEGLDSPGEKGHHQQGRQRESQNGHKSLTWPLPDGSPAENTGIPSRSGAGIFYSESIMPDLRISKTDGPFTVTKIAVPAIDD